MIFSTLLLASLPLAALAAPTAPASNVTLTAQAVVVGNGIEATVQITGYLDGSPTIVTVTGVQGLLDNTNSPYLYHVHTNPIAPGDTTCDSALGHLDPLNVTESLTCDPLFPQYCQEGDVSGKHGPLVGTASGAIATFSFASEFLRFFPQDVSVLGRSIVIHSANKTRLACGNITSTLDGTASAVDGSPTFNPSTYVTNYPTAPPFNPAVIATPFVGATGPTKAELLNMTFPLPNPAIPITKSTLWINVIQAAATAFFDGAKQSVELFEEVVVAQFTLPF